MRNKQFVLASLLLALSATGITYSAIVQKSTPVTPRSPITSNTTNNIVQDITALNAAIDAITGGSDAKIGTLTNSKWCTSDGSKIQCTADAPSGGTISEATVDGYCSNNGYLTAETDPKVGTITESKYCLGVSGKVDCTANAPTLTETDPKVGTLTNAKWCTSDGSKVNCAENAPSVGSSAWGDLTGVPAGFSDGTDADTIYTHPTTAGNKHVPAGGATDNVLKYSADGTAVWGAETDPKVGTITESKYCLGIGGKVDCTTDVLSGGGKFIDGTNTADAVYTTGKVGIGTTTPSTKLTVDTGNITLTDAYKLQWGGNNNYIGGSTASNFVAIGTSGSEQIRIDSSGNVGIGTSTPNEKLSVNGVLSIAELDVSPDSTSGFGKLYSKLISFNYYTTLLMHADGTFIDSSIFNRNISVSGQTTHSTTQSKFGGKSIYFSGDNDWISAPASSDFNFGTDPFTIDFWFYRERSNVQETLLNSWADWYATDNWGMYISSANKLSWFPKGYPNDLMTGGTNITQNAWHHAAFTYDGTTCRMFLDGNLEASLAVVAGSNSDQVVIFGTNAGAIGSYSFLGYLDELRVSKGVAHWITNFTPPTSAYTTESGTITDSDSVLVYKNSNGKEIVLKEKEDFWRKNLSDIYYYTGNVGIGISNPTYKLQVNGQPAANGYTAFTNYSDQRLKENIKPLATGYLDKIMQLKPTSFNYNKLTGYDETTRKRTINGFIAQELAPIFPDMIGHTTINGTDYLDTNLSALPIFLTKAMQEQQSQIVGITSIQSEDIAKLKVKNAKLEQENAEIKEENAGIKERLDKLEMMMGGK